MVVVYHIIYYLSITIQAYSWTVGHMLLRREM